MAVNFAALRDEASVCLSFIRIFVCLVIFGVISYKRSKSKTFSIIIEASVPKLALELPQKS